jgi:hypothetical protein
MILFNFVVQTVIHLNDITYTFTHELVFNISYVDPANVTGLKPHAIMPRDCTITKWFNPGIYNVYSGLHPVLRDIEDTSSTITDTTIMPNPMNDID